MESLIGFCSNNIVQLVMDRGMSQNSLKLIRVHLDSSIRQILIDQTRKSKIFQRMIEQQSLEEELVQVDEKLNVNLKDFILRKINGIMKKEKTVYDLFDGLPKEMNIKAQQEILQIVNQNFEFVEKKLKVLVQEDQFMKIDQEMEIVERQTSKKIGLQFEQQESKMQACKIRIEKIKSRLKSMEYVQILLIRWNQLFNEVDEEADAAKLMMTQLQKTEMNSLKDCQNQIMAIQYAFQQAEKQVQKIQKQRENLLLLHKKLKTQLSKEE